MTKERIIPCDNCEKKPCIDNPYNEGECWNTPKYLVTILKESIKLRKESDIDNDLDPYRGQ